ncbi:ThuA domain-containing protein [Fontisphaera persica]|uniref:ThuA domain-containing protein n=1 Tax=Fontisphaera persica TaxID=2974023 RepID=UPI0024BF6ED5|nr:ThuA domain-containing protein [Fontisphaera persica]WCJ59169.1 ThuA domain-containing protein [Fontisphaera persica]
MKSVRWFLWAAVMSCGLLASWLPGAEKIRVLVITGGHDYQTNEFWQVFKDNPAITFQPAVHPQAHDYWKAEAARQWDVMVLYDMWQPISAQAKSNLVARLHEGKGLVALHHSLANYQDWPEYRQIVGGKYVLKKEVLDGVERPGSTFKHDVLMQVRIASTAHPITRGLKDFEIHDETYGGLYVHPEVIPLLLCDTPTSSPIVAWAKTYANARVAAIQLGHDRLAYENPNFRKVLAQAIAWVARQP